MNEEDKDMRERLLKKGLVLGIISLFVCTNFVSGFNIQLKNTTIPLINSRGYIQDLIDNASDGDTIYIPSGIYYENIIINKSICLVGEDKNTTIIDGSEMGDVITIVSDWINISGFTIQNSGNIPYNTGIEIDSCHNTVSSNIIINNSFGIILWSYGICNNVSGNNISNNECGILLESEYSYIINNIITNNINGYGIGNYGRGNIISGNTITNVDIGIGLYCFSNTVSGNNLSNNNRGIDLVEDNNTITGNSITYNSDGINLLWCRYNNIINNTISNNGDGITFEYFSNCNTVSCNDISSNNGDGIYLYSSSGNNITDNNISNNYNGIYLYSSSNNIIIVNNISNNEHGICLEDSSSNKITDSNVLNNNWYGLLLYESSGNNIKGNIISNNYYGIKSVYTNNNNFYHNDFIDNIINAQDFGKNIWDDGKYGNYWSDYEQKYPNAHKKPLKGIWDKPYEITGGNNKDMCPLIKRWSKSKSKTISGNTPSKSYNLQRFLERFLMLERLLNLR